MEADGKRQAEAVSLVKKSSDKRSKKKRPLGGRESGDKAFIVEALRFGKRLPEQRFRAERFASVQDRPQSSASSQSSEEGISTKWVPKEFTTDIWVFLQNSSLWTHFDVLNTVQVHRKTTQYMKVEKGAYFGSEGYYTRACIKRNYLIRLKQSQCISLLLDQKAKNPFSSPNVQEIAENMTASRRQARVLKA